mmetsp:Transcript_20040/g.51661  ORF Transcript_20040/g.51661 Transcript_20040/m.51661 type:complete len:280 (+) Transcript_20040:262-1101(+)
MMIITQSSEARSRLVRGREGHYVPEELLHGHVLVAAEAHRHCVRDPRLAEWQHWAAENLFQQRGHHHVPRAASAQDEIASREDGEPRCRHKVRDRQSEEPEHQRQEGNRHCRVDAPRDDEQKTGVDAPQQQVAPDVGGVGHVHSGVVQEEDNSEGYPECTVRHERAVSEVVAALKLLEPRNQLCAAAVDDAEREHGTDVTDAKVVQLQEHRRHGEPRQADYCRVPLLWRALGSREDRLWPRVTELARCAPLGAGRVVSALRVPSPGARQRRRRLRFRRA